MARTQAVDYDQKRDAITQAAAYLFAESGFNGSSISQLSVQCKTSKSLIYHYYPSKEAILFDVMNVHVDDLICVIEEIESLTGSPVKKFKTLASKLMQCCVDAADYHRVLLYELDNLPTKERRTIVEKQRRIAHCAESLLSQIEAKKRGKNSDLGPKVMLFFGMLNWTHNWYNPKGSIERDQLAEMAAEMTINSV
ncbi:TetR/AcrR family transcriptional regulator [Kineobactrum salinum]|uniref:TetR/AcrR family transcriptional regulator n=1 Tax=Kineobactrum salinum TaxID=2708301 RepID=A0A6C0U3Y4_9GAMM|nr:TetR/AcrR family transcriptional regulator [Kineobactrum salinum]QIB66821.1 TetR/AcrR family transcriptional regulator [Kineobactrum salinum]